MARHVARFALLLALLGAPALLRPAFAEDAKPAEPDPDETRGYVGYSPAIAQLLTPEQRTDLKVTRTSGLVVVGVLPGGPAEKAGLQVDDLLLKINGEAVPDTSRIGPKDQDEGRKYMETSLRALTHKVKPGDAVELVVERAGKNVTLKAVAIDKAASDALRDAAAEEESAVKVPEPKDRGVPAPATYDFEKLPEGENRPADFLQVTGLWEATTEEGKPTNHVLRQESDLGEGFAVCLAVADGRLYENGSASVRFAVTSGERSVSAGIVFRARSWKNYYVARADGVAKNLRIYAVKDKRLEVLASVDMGSPKLGSWHTLEVSFQGDRLKAVLDGKTTVEAKDATFASGWSGIATFGDSATLFDDVKLAPAAGPSK